MTGSRYSELHWQQDAAPMRGIAYDDPRLGLINAEIAAIEAEIEARIARRRRGRLAALWRRVWSAKWR